jgi:hypothetical protein
MPNWAETDVAAVMPTRKVEEFKSYFLSHNPEENKDRKKYFGRTFLNDVNEEKNAKGMSLVRVNCDCAWSADSCMVEGYQSDGKEVELMNLEKAIKACEIHRLTLRSYEPGIGFEESATYDADKDKEVKYESRDLYPDPGCECLDDDESDDQKNGQKEMQ